MTERAAPAGVCCRSEYESDSCSNRILSAPKAGVEALS